MQTSKDTKDIGAIQKAADFVQAFILGFEVEVSLYLRCFPAFCNPKPPSLYGVEVSYTHPSLFTILLPAIFSPLIGEKPCVLPVDLDFQPPTLSDRHSEGLSSLRKKKNGAPTINLVA